MKITAHPNEPQLDIEDFHGPGGNLRYCSYRHDHGIYSGTDCSILLNLTSFHVKSESEGTAHGIIFIIVCLLGLGGNIFLFSLVSCGRKLQTHSNLYLLNRALAEGTFLLDGILVGVTMLHNSWDIGEFTCKAFTATIIVFQYVPIIFLTFMAVDCYIVGSPSISALQYRCPIQLLVVMTVWIGAAIICFPISWEAKLLDVENLDLEHTKVCMNNSHNLSMTLLVFFFMFLTPLTITISFSIVAYLRFKRLPQDVSGRETRKTTRLVMVLAGVLCIGQLPSRILEIVAHMDHSSISLGFLWVVRIVATMPYVSISIQPVLCIVLQPDLRQAVKNCFHCTCIKPSKTSTPTTISLEDLGHA
ncbi:unnamed protein product, partial [Meganyctiphanes norvegica]